MEIKAKKSLGQHFLTSTYALSQIISAAQLKKGEIVLEIGPGTGILTRALLDADANVIAIEKDERAFAHLNEKLQREITEKRLNLIQGDILELNIPILQSGNYALIANIPYYITGAILERFLEHEPRPNRMVLLVQKEVAERIVARDDKESVLSISVKAFGTPKIITTVPRGAFSPAPKVDSAILAIEDISDRRFLDYKINVRAFFRLIKAGFAHKRKFLIRNLEEISAKGSLETIWDQLNLDSKIRAEDLKLEKWLNLAANLAPTISKDRQ